jgi:hypothetical protein
VGNILTLTEEDESNCSKSNSSEKSCDLSKLGSESTVNAEGLYAVVEEEAVRVGEMGLIATERSSSPGD